MPRASLYSDTLHRYAPNVVLIFDGRNAISGAQVISTRAYPPGTHPPQSVIKPELTAVELVTVYGSRWYGCERAYINSELRMVLVGDYSRDEVRAQWAIVPNILRDDYRRPKCDMEPGCTAPPVYLDDKGFVYCREHGQARKQSGRRCRLMTRAELRRIANGVPIAKY